ncbi:MAG TPA: CRTAC1 family protein [Urbifossiella sp.]|nr:CRTAC1 family protein [Urbifossiella sp.]
MTDRLGINFTHDPGPTGSYLMPQIVGSGCAAHDLDGDGRPDLLFLTNGGPAAASRNKLYRQKADGTFEDVSAGSGLDFPGHNMGVAVGDYDNDGKPDVLITLYTGTRLFRNLGGMKFRDVTEEAGVRNPLWAAAAVFFDYDRDGRLDLFVVNYLDYDPSWDCTAPGGGKDFCAPKVFAGTCSKLFHNLGPGPDGAVRFEDATTPSGVGQLAGPGLGVTVADFDGDGWPDVFVANDGKANRLWINQRNGTFREEAISRGVAYTMGGQAFAGMGVAVGDADNDGLLDLYVTHLTAETNTFWKQGPRGQFRDETGAWAAAAAAWRGTGFGAVMADFDLDGFSDLAVVNGRVSKGDRRPAPGLPAFWEPYAERNQVFAGDGGRRFRDVSLQNDPFCKTPNVGRGLSCADLDGDGAPDLVTMAVGGRARVYRNVCPDRGHWLAVRCLDPGLNRDALGAEVKVVAGERRWFRVVCPSVSYLSSNPATALFGLGRSEVYDRVEVGWPDGTREVFPGGRADRARHVRKGEGRAP